MKKRTAVGLAVILAAAGAAWMLTDEISEHMQNDELRLLKEQVRSAAVNCYASEGRYPQTLDYLTEHYGLVFDEERYSVRYDAFASNILPDIDVSVKGDAVP